MFKDSDLFWKNFRLGTELQISGSFIYNAIYFFDQMEHFYYEEECFEFLYNCAVGLERLGKIVVVLLEHTDETDQEKFEKTLITHNQLEIYTRIKKIKSLSFGKNHIKFLQLLSTFYNSTRYDRFNLASVYHKNQDKALLIKFIEESLDIKIQADQMFPSENSERIKKFIGRTVIAISTKYYEIIRDRAFELNIYTYELSYESKAFKIFIEKGSNFDKEKLFQREIIVSLLNNSTKDIFFDFVKSIRPMDLSSYGKNEYIQFLMNFHKKRHMLSELEYLYEETKFDKGRHNDINMVGSDTSFELPDNDI